MHANRNCLIAAFLGLLALAGGASPANARTRGETVAGWRIAYGGSGDGGHLVRLSRRGRGYSFEHVLEYWRGNGGVVMGATFRRGRCSSGDASAIVPHELGLDRETLDQRLASYLRECPLSRAETVALHQTLDAAWPAFLARARRARAAIDAENEAIVRHGE